MTVFRNNSEPDPMPATAAHIEQQAANLAGKQTSQKATAFTGQDAGLSQSLADLKKGYADAAQIQSEQSQAAAIQRASVDSQIAANTPSTSVEFINHRPEQYTVGDSSTVPTSDPMWKMPVEHLRTNLELLQDTYRAVDRVSQTRSPKDFQIAAELGERLQQSMERDLPRESQIASQPEIAPVPQEKPEAFPNGQTYHLTQNPDGTMQVEYITGEKFSGDPMTVLDKIARSHIATKQWAQQQRTQATQQHAQPLPLIPASQTQYDEYGAPILQEGQTSIPDLTYQQLDLMARALGYNDISELATDQINLRQETNRLSQELAEEREARETRETAATFLAQNPDFPNTEDSINALDQIITANNLSYTPGHMAMAHDYAIKTGAYKPLSEDAIQAAMGLPVQSRRPAPPPMLRSGSPDVNQWQGDHDPYKMPLDELRRAAIRQQLEGKTPTLEYR